MNKATMMIWGRSFDLDVIMQSFQEDVVSDTQKEALTEFLATDAVMDSVKEEVESYICSHSDRTIKEIDNVFKYVIPKSLFIPKSSKKTIAILCDFKFDYEHGLAIVFEEGALMQIGPQDIII